jgi:hypothetical protein
MLHALIGISVAFSTEHLASRRSVLSSGLGLAAATALPPHAQAKTTTASFASGYFEAPPAGIAEAVIRQQVISPLNAALAKRDWSAAQALYLPEAILVDALQRGPPAFVLGAAVGSHLAAGAPIESIGVKDIVLEGEYGQVAHVKYLAVPASGGSAYEGLMRLVNLTPKTKDWESESAWRVDEDLYPLESPKLYAMIKPQRDLVRGKVFMALDPQLKLKKK